MQALGGDLQISLVKVRASANATKTAMIKFSSGHRNHEKLPEIPFSSKNNGIIIVNGVEVKW